MPGRQANLAWKAKGKPSAWKRKAVWWAFLLAGGILMAKMQREWFTAYYGPIVDDVFREERL